MQGKLGKAVKICYGHATVMLLEASFKELSQIAALIMFIFLRETECIRDI